MKSREQLLVRLKPAILSAVKKYCNIPNQSDDLIQEGYEVIIRALGDFDTKRGVHFLGYVKAMLKFHYLNRSKSTKFFVSLNQPIDSADDDIELIDTIADRGPTQEDILIRKERDSMIRTSLSSLTERQKKVVFFYYVEGISIEEISKKMGVSYRTVVNTKTAAIKKLKNSFLKE